jgi:pathogenesis-related protein 1
VDRTLAPALLLALAACGSSSSGSQAGSCAVDTNDHSAGEPAELAGITAAHNAVRAHVCVGPLTWDPALAATAAAWVAQCQSAGGAILDHNPSRGSGATYFGENIYAASGNSLATASGAVNAWAAEAQSYHGEPISSAVVQAAGHYTQLVWASSTRLGCAKHYCSSIAYGYTIVCDYAPGGNIIGQRPY